MSLQTLSESEIIMTLLALALLLAFAFGVGTLMEWIKAPRVVGEITGGILLGSTFLYHFFPEVMGGIFMAYEQEGKVLNIFYQLGLICLWILLNAATRIASIGVLRVSDMLLVVGFTLGLFVVAKLISDHAQKKEYHIKAVTFYSLSFIVSLAVCAGLYKAGINIMYSAFLVGYLVKSFVGDAKESEPKKRMEALGNFAFSFFVPIYFALVGIQLNLIHDFSLVRFLIFFVIAFGLEAVGTLIFLQFTNLNVRTKLNFAVTMNARGGPGIVLATVAYSYQIISVEFFTVLILTTMLSSLIAGYWLRRQQKLDPDIFMNLTKAPGRKE